MAPKRYLTREDILALADTNPEFAEFKSKNEIPRAPWHDPPALRAGREELVQKNFLALGNAGTIYNVPMRDGFESAVRVYKPKEAPANGSPLVVLFYGGGFTVGDTRSVAAYALTLGTLYGVTAVLPSYRLAPENPWPAAQHDAWDTLLWLSENASSLGADPGQGFVIGGISAGGNLTAALAQKWTDEQRSPKLTGIWLSIPLVFANIKHVPAEYKDSYLAREQNAHADVIPEAAIQQINQYQAADNQSPLYSPINSPNPDKHKNLAKQGVRVYFQAAGQDPLRDDALIYERILGENGVETRMDVYAGVPHGHMSFFPFLTEAKRATSDTSRNFAWLLHREEPSDEDLQRLIANPGHN